MQTFETYYASAGGMTEAGPFAAAISELPRDLPALVDALQHLVVHIFWAERYGLKLSKERQQEVSLRTLQLRLQRLFELDPAPLSQARPLERRLVSNCRDFSTMMTGFLRALGVPARARCGFGTYFMPGHFEDHWMVEVWNGARWLRVDTQLDALQRQVLKISFDPLDMPEGAFVTGGKAWLMCRYEGVDPDRFGIFEYKGWDFVRGNLYRDFLALNKVEVLPWDFWQPLMKPCAESSATDLSRCDELAELTLAGNEGFNALREVYESSPELHAPAEWSASG